MNEKMPLCPICKIPLIEDDDRYEYRDESDDWVVGNVTKIKCPKCDYVFTEECDPP